MAVLAVVSGLTVLSQGARLADGSAVLPLDDAYIHLQYGWQASQGHFLQYNTGDTPTTGATSLLYLLLLAGGFALGIARTAMPDVMRGLGLILFPLAAALLADTARRLAERHTLPGPAWAVGLVSGCSSRAAAGRLELPDRDGDRPGRDPDRAALWAYAAGGRQLRGASGPGGDHPPGADPAAGVILLAEVLLPARKGATGG